MRERLVKTIGQDCGGKASGLAFYEKKNSMTLVCYVTTSADPFNLLSDVSDVQFGAPVLYYNFEFCTSTLIAQIHKEGHDKFSNQLKPPTVALANIWRF